MASEALHEPLDRLSEGSLDLHRAISSLMEELEAVDWYQQRVDGSDDPELKAILAHNRDEEIEHAAMVIEWLRRNNAKFDEELGTYLYAKGAIVEAEAAATGGGGEASGRGPGADGSLGIGSLKGDAI